MGRSAARVHRVQVEKSHDSMVHAPWWQEISRLCVSLEPKVFTTIPAGSPARGGSAVLCDLTVFNGARAAAQSSCFPLRGNAALAAKGCTRLRVEMKRKGCPDRQTAARLVEWSFEALAVQHPRATLWPSPPRWEACHLILSRLRFPANQVPLPPQGGARVSGTISCFPLRGNAAQRQKGVRGCV